MEKPVLTIDHHCHLLPGLDDGSSSLEESLAMARLLAAAGYTEVHCTPHCLKGMYETTPAQVRAAVAALQAELVRAGIPLQLQPGMEYCLDEFFGAELDRLLPLGASRLVLVELPFQGEALLVKEQIFQLRRRQFTPLIAHPERSPLLRPQPEPGGLGRLLDRFVIRPSSSLWARLRLRSGDGQIQNSKFKIQNSLLADLGQMGCLFQGNLGSFSGFYGGAVQKMAEAMRQGGLYHCFGTDAHRASQLQAILNFEF